MAADFLLLEGGIFDGGGLLLELDDGSETSFLILESSPDDGGTPTSGLGGVYRPVYRPRRR